jgi:citrate synthase
VAERKLLALLKQGERVPGFGHRVYRDVDPRSVAHRELSAQQAAANDDTRLHDVAIAAEQLMRAQKNLPSNVDLYAATLYDALGIEASLFTPLFAIARLPGWTAHIFEQRQSARLMQPTLIESDLPPRGWPVTH